MVTALKRGDDVITSGGIIGTIERVHEDDKVDLSISENITVTVDQIYNTKLYRQKVIQKNNYIFSVIFFKN